MEAGWAVSPDVQAPPFRYSSCLCWGKGSLHVLACHLLCTKERRPGNREGPGGTGRVRGPHRIWGDELAKIHSNQNRIERRGWEERAVIGMEPERRQKARSDSKCELVLWEGVKVAVAKAESCLRACDAGTSGGTGGGPGRCTAGDKGTGFSAGYNHAHGTHACELCMHHL